MEIQSSPETASPMQAPITTGLGASKLRAWLPKIIMALVALLLFAAGAYGGYAWEHNRALTTENDLRHQINVLKQGTTSSGPSSRTTIHTTGPACTKDNLLVAKAATQGAAGTTGITYAFTNTSAQACGLNGAPIVTLADSSANELGQATVTSGLNTDMTVTVQPNGKAYVTVLFPNPANFPAGTCSANEAATIRFDLGEQNGTLQTAISGQHYCPGFAAQAFTATAP